MEVGNQQHLEGIMLDTPTVVPEQIVGVSGYGKQSYDSAVAFVMLLCGVQ